MAEWWNGDDEEHFEHYGIWDDDPDFKSCLPIAGRFRLLIIGPFARQHDSLFKVAIHSSQTQRTRGHTYTVKEHN